MSRPPMVPAILQAFWHGSGDPTCLSSVHSLPPASCSLLSQLQCPAAPLTNPPIPCFRTFASASFSTQRSLYNCPCTIIWVSPMYNLLEALPFDTEATQTLKQAHYSKHTILWRSEYLFYENAIQTVGLLINSLCLPPVFTRFNFHANKGVIIIPSVLFTVGAQ